MVQMTRARLLGFESQPPSTATLTEHWSYNRSNEKLRERQQVQATLLCRNRTTAETPTRPEPARRATTGAESQADRTAGFAAPSLLIPRVLLDVVADVLVPVSVELVEVVTEVVVCVEVEELELVEEDVLIDVILIVVDDVEDEEEVLLEDVLRVEV